MLYSILKYLYAVGAKINQFNFNFNYVMQRRKIL